MIIVGTAGAEVKCSFERSGLRMASDGSAAEGTRQGLVVAGIGSAAGTNQQALLVAPAVVEDVDARVDRPEVAAVAAPHLVVQVRTGAPAGVADEGDGLPLLDALADAHRHALA